jgi:hypothetical protein
MESTAFFERKISLSPSDLNELKSTPLEELLMKKARDQLENKCSEQGFVLPGSVQFISRSMGYFESARFTGDTNYYVKMEGKVIYPVDGIRVLGSVIRKNKMGLYINYKDAIRIQVPRDLHIGNQEYDSVKIGDIVHIELKRSKFAIHDTYILASGLFISKQESETEEAVQSAPQDVSEESSEEPEESSEEKQPAEEEQEEEEEEEEEQEEEEEEEEEQEEEEEEDE